MKKISTLFMGLIIALSAVAAPLQFGKKHVAQTPKFVAERVLAEKAGLLKAPKAQNAEVEELAVVAMESDYYAAYGIYAYILVAEEGSVFYFCFPSAEGEDMVELDHTYTLSDMKADYCYYDYGGYGYMTIPFTSASFVKSVDEEGYVSIIAEVGDSYGFEYKLTYDEASIPEAPKGGDFELSDVELYTWTDSCQYILQNDSLAFYFAFSIENLVSGQTYTENDMVAEYTGIVFNGYTTINVSALEFVATDGEDGAFTVVATILDENGDTWNVTGTYVPEVSDMTFAFAADDATGITVTPSNNDDAWDWFVVDAATFATVGADYIAEVIYQNYGDYYAITGEKLLAWDADLANYLSETGDYVLVVWGAGSKNVTTPAASYEFHFVAPEGVENTQAAVKAAKVMRNGQLFIIKNGVEYNALGTIVK